MILLLVGRHLHMLEFNLSGLGSPLVFGLLHSGREFVGETFRKFYRATMRRNRVFDMKAALVLPVVIEWIPVMW